MFKDAAGRREITQEVSPNLTLGDVLRQLAQTYGKDFNDILDPKTGQISTDTLVMLNGQSMRKTNVRVNDGDVIMISVPIGGG